MSSRAWLSTRRGGSRRHLLEEGSSSSGNLGVGGAGSSSSSGELPPLPEVSPAVREAGDPDYSSIEMRAKEYVDGAIFNTNGHHWHRNSRPVGDKPVRVSRAWKSDSMSPAEGTRSCYFWLPEVRRKWLKHWQLLQRGHL